MDSNHRPSESETDALSSELHAFRIPKTINLLFLIVRFIIFDFT